MQNKYCRVMSRHLKALSEPGVTGRDYVFSYEEFLNLFEQLDEATNAGVVSAAQSEAIQAVFACIEKVANDLNDGLVGYDLYIDDGFREAPAWEPMREAARAAIEAIEQ